jgi:predicted dehydrogenase
MMGPVAEVTAHTTMLAHERIEVEDVAVATLKFANGALGVIEASTAVWPGELKRIEIHGSQGSIAMREEDIIRWEFAKKTKADEELLTKMAARHILAAAQPTRKRSATTATPASSKMRSKPSRSERSRLATERKAGGAWRLFWPSTSPPNLAKRCSCR